MTKKTHFDDLINALIDFFLRKRSRGVTVIKIAGGLLLALIVGYSLSINIPLPDGPITLSWSDTGVGPFVSFLLFGSALALLAFGAFLTWQEHKADSRKKVFVLEFRGLRDWNGPPLSESVPMTIDGQREQILIDLRQRVVDGYIVAPQVAIDRIMSLQSDLERREAALDRRDFKYVVGGLAPVPLTFLTGIVLDDETPYTLMDWDRHTKVWRSLDEEDDGRRFSTHGLDSVSSQAAEVILAISASYAVDLANAQKKCAGLQVVHLELVGATNASHWSEAKQIALGKQFLDTVLTLSKKGVQRIHLFFAGPNSLVLRFGSLYDKRNLPAVTIYQYDQGNTQPFTWSVEMPVAGRSAARLIGT
jgi:hypothetical protein